MSGSDNGLVGEHEDSRSWYTKSDLASPYFPFPSIEVAKFMAWDCAAPMVSRRKLDSLLRLITDPSFDISKLVGYSAAKLRRTKRKLPIIPVRQWSVGTLLPHSARSAQRQFQQYQRVRDTPPGPQIIRGGWHPRKHCFPKLVDRGGV